METGKGKKPGALWRWLRLGLELVLAGALLAVLIGRGPQPEPAPETVTVRFYTPGEAVTERTVEKGGTLRLEPPAALEGYTFTGWRDAQGNIERREELTVYEDAAYSAVYAMALDAEGHTPYLDIDQGRRFRPNDPLTRREAVLMLYRLLDTDLVGSDRFADVPRSDPCYAAACTLKTLGVVTGSRLHPEDAVTRGELLQMLAPFYPQGTGDYAFRDLDSGSPWYPAFRTAAAQGWIDSGKTVDAKPEEALTRLETARLMNRVLGRSGDSAGDVALTGTILDLPFRDPDFWQAAEAAIPHEYTREKGAERWTEAEGLPLLEEGFLLLDKRLHCIDSEGSAVVGASVGRIAFDENGQFTTGMPELDELIFQVLEEQIDPETMEDEEMLHALFTYTAQNFRYLRRNYYDYGATGWEAEEAYTMLSTRKGNCYNYAAAFCVLARAIGYDAAAYSGSIRGDVSLAADGSFTTKRPHAWVEIDIDGETYLFDPEMQGVGYTGGGDGTDFFQRGDDLRNRFEYTKYEESK